MKKNESKKQSKMSLAAKRAWETRRKKYGKKAGAGSGASEEAQEISVEQLKRAYRKGYRKGFLVEKTGRSRQGGAVKIDEKMREYLDFLYGRKWFEEVVLRKLWAEANRLAKKMIWSEKTDQ